MLTLVAGTRPNFVKIAPIRRALHARGIPVRLLHTGQHVDPSMSDVFFRDLDLPAPDSTLTISGRTHAEQTAAILVGVEADLIAHRPNAIVVVGDVTSTLAAALAASKIGVPIVHVEAGLRSRDWKMPEEINRVLTDQLADLLLTPARDAAANLLAEGIPQERIAFVGNVMIDSLRFAREHPTDVIKRLGLERGRYAITTFHRPENVDEANVMLATLEALETVASRIATVLPLHPRAFARLDEFGFGTRLRSIRGLHVTEPLGYCDFVTLLSGCLFAATDSGGIQEETTALAIPCLTIREGTERPITVEEGTNTIVGTDVNRLATEVDAIIDGRHKRGRIPEGWDGRAAERVADAVVRFLDGFPLPKRSPSRR